MVPALDLQAPAQLHVHREDVLDQVRLLQHARVREVEGEVEVLVPLGVLAPLQHRGHLRDAVVLHLDQRVAGARVLVADGSGGGEYAECTFTGEISGEF